jgi:exodeoxyribonuclease VII large subunit
MNRIEIAKLELKTLAHRQVLRDPMTPVMLKAQHLDELWQRLHNAAEEVAEDGLQQMSMLAGKLHALSPLGVMARGYTITMNMSKNILVNNPQQVTIGDTLQTRLKDGSVISKVEEVCEE